MNNNNPWADIRPPVTEATFTARRIAGVGNSVWGLFWAIDIQGHCLLILEFQGKYPSKLPLPRLRGLLVEARPIKEQDNDRIIIRLIDDAHRDIFHRLCIDLIDATKNSQRDEEVAKNFLIRLKRWHFLLRGGGETRLSQEEQKGLIGELWLLEHVLIPSIGPTDAVKAWKGPFGAPKDFQVGIHGIETKAKSPQVPNIRIHSAEQLDATGVDRLFLNIVEVTSIYKEPASVTIMDLAIHIRDIIESEDISTLIQFEESLSATGFRWNDDYSDSYFLIGDTLLYEVLDGFPRITASKIASGVQDVQYSITLSDCEHYKVEMSELIQAISGKNQ